MTFASASASACEVDDVAATAACGGGLRTGGKAACRRVVFGRTASPVAAGGPRTAILGAVVDGAIAVAGNVPFADACGGEACGTALRALGRGFGNGTCDLAQAPIDNTDRPMASARLVANALGRKAAERLAGVTAFLRGKSFSR
jgi:hypothetical protein